MLSFHEPESSNNSRDYGRCRNEISFASPRGTGAPLRAFQEARGGPTHTSSSSSSSFFFFRAQPVASSNFLFVSRREQAEAGIRHQGVYGKDFVTGRYYSVFCLPPPPPFRQFLQREKRKHLLDILFNLLISFPRWVRLPLLVSSRPCSRWSRLNDRPRNQCSAPGSPENFG